MRHATGVEELQRRRGAPVVETGYISRLAHIPEVEGFVPLEAGVLAKELDYRRSAEPRIAHGHEFLNLNKPRTYVSGIGSPEA